MMLDVQTIEFVGFLNMLAEMSEDGIHPFSTATRDQSGLFYDDQHPIEIGNPHHLDIDGEDVEIPVNSSYPLVADYLIGAEHHDVVSTWTREYAPYGIDIVVMAGGEDDPWVSVTFKNDRSVSIVVENGRWYV